MDRKNLTPEQIELLKMQHCTAEDWGTITITDSASLKYINNIHFSGIVSIGKLDHFFEFPGGVRKHAQLRNAYLHNCYLGDNVLITDVRNYIANYRIGDSVVIENVNTIYVEGESTFGNGTEVSVLNETGGREVQIFDYLSSHLAYILACYRYKPLLIKQLNTIISNYISSVKSNVGRIGNNVRISNAKVIKNVKIGDFTTIDGAQLLENGTINSSNEAPVHIGYSVVANDFIISSGSRIVDGVMLDKCFVGQASHLGHGYTASHSLFFSNCQGENGEAASLFAGPYTVTHHKSTLLIAGMFSFMNAGSASNQSNHMYKLGPIHQGVVERGAKTTSNSYILWPARIGAFSLIMGRHKNNSDTSNMPFSYLIEDNDETVLVPAVNLRSVGTIRDAQKFPLRDKRKDTYKLDNINFNLLSPYTVQKMFAGIEVLEQLKHSSGASTKYYTYQGCMIKSSALERGINLYHIAIKKFLGNSLISRLKLKPVNTLDDIKKLLQPDSEIGLGKWRDLSGLLLPQSCINHFISQVEAEGSRLSVEDLNTYFRDVHKHYYSYEWTWAWDKMQSYFHLDIETLTIDHLIGIIEEWKEAVVSLDNMIYQDAKKEFSLSSKISFGLDGDKATQEQDFEEVRGAFDSNPFVTTVLNHIKNKEQLGNDVIALLQTIGNR